MITVPPDAALALKIACGDSKAEKEVFSHFGTQIKLMVWTRLKRKVALAEKEDLVSEVQEAVLSSLRKGGYDPATGKPLAAYIAGIASNVVGQYFRRQKKESMVESGVALEYHPDPQNILSDLLDAERDRILRKCLQRLPAKYKEVLLLRIYEQYSIEEISQNLGIERRRVSERIHYAFQLLAKECRKKNYFQCEDCFQELKIGRDAVTLIEKEGPTVLAIPAMWWEKARQTLFKLYAVFFEMTTGCSAVTELIHSVRLIFDGEK